MALAEQMYTDLQAQLPALQEAFKTGAEWGTELAGRYIVYDMAIHIVYVVTGLLLALMGYILWKLFIRHSLHEDLDAISAFFIPIAMFIISPFVVFSNLGIILKDIFIPEIRIIELLSTLIQ